MSGGENSPGISKLAAVILSMASGAIEVPYTLDLGTIGGDHALMCDEMGEPVPKDDYQICRACTIEHEEIRKIRPGDRVLVAWIGGDAVVIDMLVEAADVF